MTEKSELVKSLSNNLLLMKIFGIYPIDGWSRFSYTLYSYFFWLTSVPTPVLAVAKFFTGEVTLGLLSEMMFATAEIGIALLKYLPLRNHPIRTKRTIEYRLNQKIFNEYDEYQKEAIVKNVCNVSRLLYWSFVTLNGSAFMAWVLGGFREGKRQLPIDICLPFDLDSANNWVFTLVYVMMFFGAGHAALDNGSVDTLTSSLMYHATAQIKILKDNLQNLLQKVEDNMKKSYGDLHLPNDKRLELRNQLVYLRIIRCVEHHREIREFVRDIEKTFSFVFFSQLCASIVVICTTCLRLTLVQPFSAEFVSMTIILATMLFQVFLYCYFGHLLLDESLTINDAIYTGDWVELDSKSKKALLTLMENSKQPLLIVPGGLLTLSLDTFVMIIKRSYSLLAVLNNFK